MPPLKFSKMQNKGKDAYLSSQSGSSQSPSELDDNESFRPKSEASSPSPRVYPVYTAPKPAFRFVNITDPKQTKSHKFKTDVRSQAMTTHMWSKRTHPDGVTKPDPRPMASQQFLGIMRQHNVAASLSQALHDKASKSKEKESEDQQLVSFINRLPDLEGQSPDPFGLFPVVDRDIQINIPQLVHHGIKIFTTDHVNALSFWAHEMDPLTIIPNLLCTSEHMDLMNGLTSDSKRTMALRNKSLQLLNDQLQTPGSIDADITVMTITKMLSSEQVIHGEAVSVHHDALQRLVQSRGGLEVMTQKSPYMGPYITSVIFFHCIIHEIQPGAEWLAFEPTRYRLATSGTQSTQLSQPRNLDYSIYAPHLVRAKGMGFVGQLVEPKTNPSDLVEFLPIRQSRKFSIHTQGLLFNLRHAINTFLESGSDAHNPTDPTSPSHDQERQYLREILSHTQRLPSAADSSSNNPVAGDWLYECCRLTCLLIFTSMYLRIPFSRSNQLLSDCYSSPLPTTAFANALLRTDLSNCWSDMSAILTFLVVIMGAAASQITPDSEPHDFRARKWILMTYMRTCLTLGFEPGWAFNGLLRIILRIQSKLTNLDDMG